ncbi:MAG: hypothetical protein VKL98_05755 [Cyanobacteriota bacterium]|nr:hypothetical protein [Cyanobacteriota bacterium]
MTTQDITAMTALLCNLITYELEIKQVLEASDQESANYMDFRHDLAYAIAQATQPTQQEPTQETTVDRWLTAEGYQ